MKSRKVIDMLCAAAPVAGAALATDRTGRRVNGRWSNNGRRNGSAPTRAVMVGGADSPTTGTQTTARLNRASPASHAFTSVDVLSNRIDAMNLRRNTDGMLEIGAMLFQGHSDSKVTTPNAGHNMSAGSTGFVNHVNIDIVDDCTFTSGALPVTVTSANVALQTNASGSTPASSLTIDNENLTVGSVTSHMYMTGGGIAVTSGRTFTHY